MCATASVKVVERWGGEIGGEVRPDALPRDRSFMGVIVLGCLRYVYRNIRAKDHCCGVRVGL